MSAMLQPDDRITVEQLRIPPQSVEAEQAVLGGVMLAPDGYHRVSEILADADFYRRDHQLIWRAIRELGEKNQPYDAVTLGEWFQAQGLAEQVADGAYLVELASTTPSAANIVAYADIVAGKALQRQLIEAGTGIVHDGFQPDGRDAVELLAEAQHRIVSLQPKQRGGLQYAPDALDEWYADLQHRYAAEGRLTGLPTPWHDLNEATHGLQAQELTLVAARPSMGKSVLAFNLALFTALRHKRTALFSLEMNRKQIMRRNIAALQSIPHDWLLAPHDKGDRDYWPQVTEAIRALRTASLYIDETADLTIQQVMARARNLQLKEPIELLIVDHIHDFKINAKEARFEYGRIAQGLKTLAKEFNCPAVGLAQLNRNVQGRADKRPTLTDLRESGELEQKGDLILFLHREDYYDKNTHLQGVVEVSLAKGRDIEAGKVITLRNDYAHMALRDWEGPLPSPPPLKAKANRLRWKNVPGIDA